MANETTMAAFSDSVYAKILEEDVQRELRPHRVYRPFLRQGPPGPSNVFSFTTIDDSGATAYTYTEGTTDVIAGTMTSITTTGASATAVQYGIGGLVTDLVKKVSILDVDAEVSGAFGRHMAEAYDAAAQSTVGAFSNATGGATTGTLARLLTVISALEQRDVGSRGENLVGVIHAKQLGDLRADVASLTATFLAGKDANVAGILATSLDGYVGDPFGVPIYHTTTVGSASSYYKGFVMAAKQAAGAYELWLEKVEIQRDASKLSDEVICSSAYGFAIIDENRGQSWRSST